ncbi:hypothetical protein D3C72_2108560 [compost metagenome]
MDGRHDRLGRLFDHVDQGVQGRFRERLGRIEFLDIGAARKGLAGAGDDDGFDGLVRKRLADAGHGGRARRQAQAIDGRVGQGNDGNGAVHLIFSTHVSSLLIFAQR